MDNDQAGPSKQMSIEDQARELNKPFWNNEMVAGEADALARAGDKDFVLEEGEETDSTSTDGDATTTEGGGDQTEGGGDRTEGGSGSNPPAKKRRKSTRPRKDRTPQVVSNVTDTFTEVSQSGKPKQPRIVAKGYGMQLGCILREMTTINTFDLRNPQNEGLRNELLKRVHKRYIFPDDVKEKVVDNFAITRMNTMLSSWRSRVKKKIEKGQSWEEIRVKEPFIEKEDFDIFKASLLSPEAAAWTKWGKDLRAKNLGNHRLGSGGYDGKKPIWAKEDAELARLGLPNQWDNIADEQTRNFVRSRYYLKPGTGEFCTDHDDVRDFEKNLVRNLITAYISKSISFDIYMGSPLFSFVRRRMS